MVGDELVPRPATGRRFSQRTRVRLADVSATGRLRLDAIARMLQDVSSDDTADAAYAADAVWVIRKLVIELGERLPRLRDDVTLVTWCSGTGPRWAERRTDIESDDGEIAVRAAALWVFVDFQSGRPIPLGDGFDAVYGEAAGGRRVGQRLQHPPPPPNAPATPWPLRVTDLDVLGHVNNAAYWAPVEETLAGLPPGWRVGRAEVEFRGGLDQTDSVQMVEALGGGDLKLWLTVGTDVRASAVVALTPAPGRRF